jgi:hypothetical protein
MVHSQQGFRSEIGLRVFHEGTNVINARLIGTRPLVDLVWSMGEFQILSSMGDRRGDRYFHTLECLHPVFLHRASQSHQSEISVDFS